MNVDRTAAPLISSEIDVWRPRVTVATVVPRDGRFLLVEESVHGKRVINQPAGHLEPGESLQQAAIRETLEETGWHIELDCLIGVQQWTSTASGSQFVRFTFAARPLRHDPLLTLDEGIIGTLWLGREQIQALAERLRSPLVLDSIDQWIDGRRLPLDSVRQLAPGTPAI
jgi:8-oxo-dGTP pyrophosphatase MutT (NUDIX family)